MLIRKLFKIESAHIVRDCSTRRCSKSIHGHSGVIEVFLTANGLDNGQMIVDFGLLKTTIKDFIDSFDHSYSLWDKEKSQFKEFIKRECERWVEMPVSPSAEMYSLMMFFVIDKIIQNTVFDNGEKKPQLYSVRYSETDTGYAEAFREDLQWWKFDLTDINFSEQIKSEWKDPQMYDKLIKKQKFINPSVELKYQN